LEGQNAHFQGERLFFLLNVKTIFSGHNTIREDKKKLGDHCPRGYGPALMPNGVNFLSAQKLAIRPLAVFAVDLLLKVPTQFD